MIEARKSKWFERLFVRYNRNLIGRRFEGLRVAGRAHLAARGPDAPLVLYANHSSWWDALVIVHLNHLCGLDGYAMMEERQLRQYRFFRRLGAFGVVRGEARAAQESIAYGADLLRGTARALWVFPQGVTVPNDVRPLRLYSGTARIIRRLGRAYVAPVALRYEFLEDFKPEALARFGPVELVEAGDDFRAQRFTRHLAANLTATLDALRQDVLNGNLSAYEEVVAPNRRR